MKNFLITVLLFLSVFTIKAQESEITTYYFIRHAEKVKTDIADRNPKLTEKGENRAIYWSEVLAHINFDAVYSTQYNRTIQTAAPTAKKNNLEILFYNPRELYDTEFKKNTINKNVLVVGHSNTTPAFVNAVLGENKFEDIDESNNSNLYIVTINNKKATSILLKIDHN